MPIVEKFIKYYRLLRDNRPFKEENNRILRIRFEEMVYDYDNATKKIDDFLGVTNNHRKTIFQPEMSAANTNLRKKYPDLESDICRIEQELPEYLFDFDSYKTIDNTGEMFFGKSLLNK